MHCLHSPVCASSTFISFLLSAQPSLHIVHVSAAPLRCLQSSVSVLSTLNTTPLPSQPSLHIVHVQHCIIVYTASLHKLPSRSALRHCLHSQSDILHVRYCIIVCIFFTSVQDCVTVCKAQSAQCPRSALLRCLHSSVCSRPKCSTAPLCAQCQRSILLRFLHSPVCTWPEFNTAPLHVSHVPYCAFVYIIRHCLHICPRLVTGSTAFSSAYTCSCFALCHSLHIWPRSAQCCCLHFVHN